MKKDVLGGTAFLVLLALLVIWFNRNAGQDDTIGNQKENTDREYVLALSWQPAFCERRPNKPECRSQRPNRFDGRNFSLHGLWPQPPGQAYCGVPEALIETDKSGRWRDLPKLDLDDELRKELAQKMPGYSSFLHRHEWYKHGTCMPGITPSAYFRISLTLLNQINDSAVRDLLAENIGSKVQFRTLRNVMQRAYGEAAGDRFILDGYRDDGRRLIQEIKLSLKGDFGATRSLEKLLEKGAKTPRSCPFGIVDPVGPQ